MYSRRHFIKQALLGTALLTPAFAHARSVEEVQEIVDHAVVKGEKRASPFDMHAYAAPAIPTVRIGFIGIGSRGGMAVSRIMNIRQAEIVALCDNRQYVVRVNQEKLKKVGKRAVEYCNGDYGWRKLCEQPDIDLIYIATPWKWHAQMAIYAMECGKHVAVEIPAAITLDECWQLVETSERTRKHCFQLENCCYDFFETCTIQMALSGALGELVHAEGAYIHDQLPEMFGGRPDPPGYKVAFRPYEHMNKSGNLYPMHGLGPIALAMGINRGDRMEYITSVSSDDFGMAKRAAELAAKDPYYNRFTNIPYRGNMNTSVIKTARGRTLMIQHDVTSPRPYSRLHTISGMKGVVQKYPLPARMAFGHDFADPETFNRMEEQFTPELVRHIEQYAKLIGGHGGMDFIMDYRLIDCLRNGLTLDMNVYDAAAWSSVIPLSIWSVANRGGSADLPDFTAGRWTSSSPVDLSLRGGGSTSVELIK